MYTYVFIAKKYKSCKKHFAHQKNINFLHSTTWNFIVRLFNSSHSFMIFLMQLINEEKKNEN